MKLTMKVLAGVAAASLLAGCTQAYYDKQRAAGDASPPPQKPVTKQEVTNDANKVSGAVDTGAGQFGGWMKQHGFNIHTKDNPDDSSGK